MWLHKQLSLYILWINADFFDLRFEYAKIVCEKVRKCAKNYLKYSEKEKLKYQIEWILKWDVINK